jgi:hypothetical protein
MVGRKSSEFDVRCWMFDIILRKITPNTEHRISNTGDVADQQPSAYLQPNSLQPNSLQPNRLQPSAC